jgi:hypothetical protein
MALEFFAGVNIAARIDSALDEIGGLINRRRTYLLARERVAGVFSEDRRVAGVAQRNSRGHTSFGLIELHGARNADKREIAAPTRHFHKTRARTRRRWGQLYLRQHLIMVKRGCERAYKKIASRNPPLAAMRLRPQFASERQNNGWHLRGRIGVGHVTADCSTVANLRVSNVGKSLVHQG